MSRSARRARRSSGGLRESHQASGSGSNADWGLREEGSFTTTLSGSLSRVKEVAKSLDYLEKEIEAETPGLEGKVGEPMVGKPPRSRLRPPNHGDSLTSISQLSFEDTHDAAQQGRESQEHPPPPRYHTGHLEDVALPKLAHRNTPLMLPASFDVVVEFEDSVVELGEMGFALERSKLLWAEWALQSTPEAVLVDLFWWFYADMFCSPSDPEARELKEELYSRFAIHYVSINMPPSGKRPSDRHLRLYPKTVGQVVYATMRGVFPKSSGELGPEVLDRIVNQLLTWTMGIVPEDSLHWSKHLTFANSLKDTLRSNDDEARTGIFSSATVHADNVPLKGKVSSQMQKLRKESRQVIMGAGAHMLAGRSGAMSADGNLRPKFSHTRHTQEYEYETFNVHQRTPFVSRFLEGHDLQPDAPFGHVVRRTRLHGHVWEEEDSGREESYAKFASGAINEGIKARGNYERAKRQLANDFSQSRTRVLGERHTVERQMKGLYDMPKSSKKKLSDTLSGWSEPNLAVEEPIRGVPDPGHPMRFNRQNRPNRRTKDSLDILAHMVVEDRKAQMGMGAPPIPFSAGRSTGLVSGGRLRNSGPSTRKRLARQAGDILRKHNTYLSYGEED